MLSVASLLSTPTEEEISFNGVILTILSEISPQIANPFDDPSPRAEPQAKIARIDYGPSKVVGDSNYRMRFEPNISSFDEIDFTVFVWIIEFVMGIILKLTTYPIEVDLDALRKNVHVGKYPFHKVTIRFNHQLVLKSTTHLVESKSA